MSPVARGWLLASALALVCCPHAHWVATRRAHPAAAVLAAYVGSLDLLDREFTVSDAPREGPPRVDPWGRPFLEVEPRTELSLGPDGVRSADDVTVADAYMLAPRPWMWLLAWRWPAAALVALWLAAIGLATDAPARGSRWHELGWLALVIAPSILLAAVLHWTFVAHLAGRSLGRAAMWPELVLPGTLVALGGLSAAGARAWSRRGRA